MQNNGLLGCFWWFWAIILHTLGVQVPPIPNSLFKGGDLPWSFPVDGPAGPAEARAAPHALHQELQGSLQLPFILGLQMTQLSPRNDSFGRG